MIFFSRLLVILHFDIIYFLGFCLGCVSFALLFTCLSFDHVANCVTVCDDGFNGTDLMFGSHGVDIKHLPGKFFFKNCSLIFSAVDFVLFFDICGGQFLFLLFIYFV